MPGPGHDNPHDGDLHGGQVTALDLVELTEILLATSDVERALGELSAIAAASPRTRRWPG
ncbi:hypothetical protein [Nonomuraea jabiensis]|uniref:Uncharacterized protein n=1 Tax=Nonomuraea jabiensis TaxID=882448 RepID=A0A7W9G4B6_9ACTN|nr:hypothetical protein [Nonomuraea jabiensis]MBB5776902.1 hypothetical protein [Nonomuraea jabiensis]